LDHVESLGVWKANGNIDATMEAQAASAVFRRNSSSPSPPVARIVAWRSLSSMGRRKSVSAAGGTYIVTSRRNTRSPTINGRQTLDGRRPASPGGLQLFASPICRYPLALAFDGLLGTGPVRSRTVAGSMTPSSRGPIESTITLSAHPGTVETSNTTLAMLLL
jgi:hypothetical protein